MTNIWMYLIELNILLVILFGAYRLIRSFIGNRLNRLSLMILPIAAVALVFLKAKLISTGNAVEVGFVQMDEVVIGGETITSDFEFGYGTFYLTGVVLFMGVSIVKLIKIFRLFRGAERHPIYKNIKIVSTQSKDSFSFFNRIHLSAHLNKEEKEVVLDHELLHASKFHSFDLLLMEVYHSFFWFNPLLFLMKKELIQVHEFEVDQDMYSKYNVGYLKHLVSYALGASSAHLLLTSQFYNNLTLAKRINKMKNKRTNRNIFIAIVPIIGFAFAGVSWSQVEQNEKPINQAYSIPPPSGEIDQKPQFKGGQEALFAYVGEHVKYPKSCEKNNTQGTVQIEFTVLVSGAVKDAKIKKSAHPELDAEALRVVKGMPNWNPGIKDGKPVKTQMVLPITFKL